MAAGLRKCIDVGPFVTSLDAKDVRHVDPVGGPNLTKIVQSTTRWTRLWVRWDIAEPTRGNIDTTYMAALDDQINKLRAQNIGVVLVSWRFPLWSNGTEGVDPGTYLEDYRTRTDGSDLKSLYYGIPLGELGVNGAWGHWINLLVARYKHHGCGVVLEIMNEPNFQMWPQTQDTAGNDMIIHEKVAEMMNTAYFVSGFHGHKMPIAAPATSDFRRNSSRYETHISDFMVGLQAALIAMNNFRGGPTFMWSHHHYKDTELGDTAGVSIVHFVLHNWWRGWSATASDGSNPGIWLTEGGARRHAINPATYANQKVVVNAAWNRMLAFPGVAMFANYFLHSEPDPYDQGLRYPLPGAGALRPVGDAFHLWPGNS